MNLKTVIQKNVDGKLWDETSWLLNETNPFDNQKHGSEKWWYNLARRQSGESIWVFHLWRHNQRQISIHIPKEPEKNKTLFNKTQFKILCNQG